MIFEKTTTQYATFEWRYDSDGKVWTQAQVHTTLVAKTPYSIIANEYGQISSTLAAAGLYSLVGCPRAVAVAADIIWFQIGGYITSMVTAALSMAVGEAMDVNTSAVADNAADYTGAAAEFAVATAVSTTSTTQDAMLIPRQIVST